MIIFFTQKYTLCIIKFKQLTLLTNSHILRKIYKLERGGRDIFTKSFLLCIGIFTFTLVNCKVKDIYLSN
jgi:hypothetical protein